METKSIQNRIGICMFLFLSIFALSACDSVGSLTAGGLPEEGQKALRAKIQEYTDFWTTSGSIDPNWKIASAQKATNNDQRKFGVGEETWCVVIDPPFNIYHSGAGQVGTTLGREYRDFIVSREGLLWSVYDNLGESNFLEIGCSNYVHEVS